jgi:hypothetical protein
MMLAFVQSDYKKPIYIYDHNVCSLRILFERAEKWQDIGSYKIKTNYSQPFFLSNIRLNLFLTGVHIVKGFLGATAIKWS